MNKKQFLLPLNLLVLIIMIVSGFAIYKNYTISQKIDQEERLRNIETTQMLIKPIEEFSISQRLFIQKMELCFKEGKSSSGYKDCLGLTEQYTKALKSLQVVSQIANDRCQSGLRLDIESYMMIMNNHRNSNYQFLLSKLRELEAHIKSKCNI